MFWEHFCCVFPLSIFSFPLLTAAGFPKWRTGFSAVKDAFSFRKKKKTKPQNQQGGYNCTHHLQTDILQFLCGVSRIWWKVQFAHLGLMEEIELFFCRCMRNSGKKDPYVFGWTDTHKGHPSLVRTVSHLLDCLVPTISVLPGFYRTGTHWRRWGRLFAGADSGAPLSF